MLRKTLIAHAAVLGPLAILVWALTVGPLGGAFSRVDPHGAAKVLLGPWHVILYRQVLILPMLAAGLAVLSFGRWATRSLVARLASSPRSSQAVWAMILAIVVAATFVATPGFALASRVVAALFLASNLAVPDRREWAWIPGAVWLLPGPTLGSLGRVLVGLPDVLAWFWMDCFLVAPGISPLLERWERDLGPDVVVAARAPPGVHCEFHDIDVLPDRYQVVEETSLRLVARARSDDRVLSVENLPPWWGPGKGLVLDSDPDATGAHTWYVRIPNQIIDLGWNAGFVRNAVARFDPALTHTYIKVVPSLGRIVVFTVNADPSEAGRVVSARIPDLGDIKSFPLRNADGSPGTTPRDIAWIPPLQRFALAPAMGDRLWLADPLTGRVEPWIHLPANGGKLRWVPELNRLLVAIPTQPLLWVITPEGTLERRIPTQPGVRPVAVDAGRGLFLTASLLTGEVWVQRLDTGAIVRRLGPVMPMVRELEIAPETGEAWLSTWTVLYHIRYLGSDASP